MRGAVAALAALVVALLAVVAGAAPARAADRPKITAPSAILVEPATGDIVYQRQADKRRLIASTTKLMTALIALQKLPLDDVVSAVPYSPTPSESVLGLHTGDKMSGRDYLRALLLLSANDAAATLGTRIGGSQKRFVSMMNAKARQIGLKDTHYANPIGLDADGNYSTASDLVKLALVLRENATFRQITDMRSATLRLNGKPRTITNRNQLVDDVPFVNGVKTGHTNAAGYILVGSGTRNGVTVVSAVLGEPSEAARDDDSLALLKYGTRLYHVVTGIKQGQSFGQASLRYRDGQTVGLVASRTVRRTAKLSEHLTTRVIGAPKVVDGPLAQGAKVGTIELIQRGKVVGRVALVTATAVSAATATQRLGDYLGRPVTILALVVLVGCSVVLVLLRRRVSRRRSSERMTAA